MRGSLILGLLLACAGTAAADGTRKLTLTANGDIVFGRHWDGLLKPFKDKGLFEPMKPLISAADIAFANLETPVVDGPMMMPGGGHGGTIRHGLGWMQFRAVPARAKELADAGYDIVSTANNHARDMGLEAIEETRKHLLDAGITPVGTGKDNAAPYLFEKNGLKIAVLAATLVSNVMPPDTSTLSYIDPDAAAKVLAERVAAVRPKVDLVIVSLHWGVEYSQATSAEQRKIAHAAVDAGADLILGHHPHVMHGFERYAGKVIAYSMGNFIFDMAMPVKRESVLLEVELAVGADGKRTVAARALPLLIDSEHTPAPATGERAKQIRATMIKLSAKLGTKLTPAPDGSLIIE